jgi:hypothetical protein
VARRSVWSRNLENEEAKARYQAVENTNTMGCNARRTNNKQLSSILLIILLIKSKIVLYIQSKLDNTSNI